MAIITTTTPPENLTGWTVSVPAGFDAALFYGNSFYIDGVVPADNGSSFNFIGFGRSGISFEFLDQIDGTVVFNPSETESFSFSVTGGADASNSSYIQWLVDNNATFTKEGEEEGTQVDKTNNLAVFLKDLYEGIVKKKPDASKNPQDFRSEIESIADVPEWDGSVTKVTDLKGTTWELSGGFEAEAGLGQFAVDCTYKGKTYNRLGIGYGWEASLETVITFANWALLYNEGTTEYAKMTSGTYVFSITGGNDVGNSVLKDWLFKYGKLIKINLISFTIAGSPYQAEEGMTWYEWANSDYNTSMFECTLDTGAVMNGLTYVTTTDGISATTVEGTDVIIGNTEYSTVYTGTGGGVE